MLEEKSMKLVTTLLMLAAAVFASVSKADDHRKLGYVLQAESLGMSRAEVVATLANCDRDWLVLDASFDSETDGRWTADEIATIRAGRPGRRVIAYLSIGEAETYRDYWRADWDANSDGQPDASAPAFLLAENPDWEGNYRVRYWNLDWQQIIERDVRRIMQQGFDGLYLDIVDAFEQFEFDGTNWLDDRVNDETGQSYRDDMIAWVSRIRTVADAAAKRPVAIVPQNAPQLLARPSYRKTIAAVGIEDLFTSGNKKQNAGDSKYRLEFLKHVDTSETPVFVIEYASKKKFRDIAIDRASAAGLHLLITDRSLKTLGTAY